MNEVELVKSNLRATGVEEKWIEKYVKYLLSNECSLEPVSVEQEKQDFDLWLAVERREQRERITLFIIVAFFILLIPFLISGLWMLLSSLTTHTLAVVAVFWVIVTSIILIIRGGRE